VRADVGTCKCFCGVPGFLELAFSLSFSLALSLFYGAGDGAAPAARSFARYKRKPTVTHHPPPQSTPRLRRRVVAAPASRPLGRRFAAGPRAGVGPLSQVRRSGAPEPAVCLQRNGTRTAPVEASGGGLEGGLAVVSPSCTRALVSVRSL
jgi:hypothetical protein